MPAESAARLPSLGGTTLAARNLMRGGLRWWRGLVRVCSSRLEVHASGPRRAQMNHFNAKSILAGPRWALAALVIGTTTATAQHPDVVPRQILVSSTPQQNAYFGWSVSADGDWLAVGAIEALDPLGVRNGAVTLFRADAQGTLTERQVLYSSSSQAPVRGRFGMSTAMHQGRLVVAASDELRPDGRYGILHAYEYDPIVGWFETQVVLDPPIAGPLDEVRGFRMCMHGDHLFVGCRYASNTGRVLYYHHDGAGWQYVRSVWPPAHVLGRHANFSWSMDVDLEAGLLLVGANIFPYTVAAGTPLRSGRAFVFNLIGNGQQPYVIVPDGELFPPAPREGGQFGEGCCILGPGRVAVACEGAQWAAHEFYYEFSRDATSWNLTRRGGFSSSIASSNFVVEHDGVIYLGHPSFRSATQFGSAILAICLDDDTYNPAGILWQSGIGGTFPSSVPAIGDTFVALGFSEHFHNGIQFAGGVAVYPRPTPTQCLRTTIAADVCSAATTGCPSGAPLPSDPLAGCLNSSGRGGRLHYQGMAQHQFNAGRVLATGLPPSEFAVLLRGRLQAGSAAWNPAGQSPLGSGMSCLIEPLNTPYPVRRIEPDGTARWHDVLEVVPNTNG